MSIGEIIKVERTKKGISQAKLGEILNLTQQAVGRWEKNKSEPDSRALNEMANLFNVSVDYLLGRESINQVATENINAVEAIEHAPGISNKIKDEVEINDYFPIPLLGSVVAGVPIESQENTEGYVYISFRPKEEYFALRVHGDSMINAGIKDKSVLIVHKQENAENGDIIVAMLNKEQTVKKFKQVGNTVFLMPENPAYDPIPVAPTDELIILGKVVEVRIAL